MDCPICGDPMVLNWLADRYECASHGVLVWANAYLAQEHDQEYHQRGHGSAQQEPVAHA